MKSKTKKGLLITVGLITALFFYGKYNFENDKQELIRIKILALNSDSKTIFQELERDNKFTNPLIYIAYKRWESQMYSRFVDKDEVFDNTSDNKLVHDLSNIFRNYYADEFLKEGLKNRSYDSLYDKLSNYLYHNKLTKLSKDSLKTHENVVSEIANLLEKDGFEYRFLQRNGIQELLIWNDITEENYEVVLPSKTVNTTVIFINSFHLEDFDSFVTYGGSSVGGWALKEKATLYCNKSGYSSLNSEGFNISYLKHETLHFTDLNDYPNLSATDLEYRSKLVELMYLTDETMYSKLSEFLNDASIEDRNYTHAYANFILMQNLSKNLFNSEFENDQEVWKSLEVETINKAAEKLFNSSNSILSVNTEVIEVI